MLSVLDNYLSQSGVTSSKMLFFPSLSLHVKAALLIKTNQFPDDRGDYHGYFVPQIQDILVATTPRITFTAVLTASAQNDFDNLDSTIIARAASHTMRLYRTATLFRSAFERTRQQS